MNFRNYLVDKIRRQGFSPAMNLFLFGFESYDAEETATKIEKDRRFKPKDYSDIKKKIDGWTSAGRNLSANFNLDDLSVWLDIPKRQLLDYFQIYLKKDFRLWKTEKRIERACLLLLESTDLEVREVAAQTGFADMSNFHRQFKKITGCTPLQWREYEGKVPAFIDERV